MIAEYEKRVHAITINIKPKNPNSISNCPSVYKKVIDSFLATLLTGSVSPCRAALVIHHDIPAHDDFQALIAEL
jgi:hypothetical protein